MEHSNKRIVQKKGKSIYVNLPPEDTGLQEGDVIEFRVLSEGNILLRKLEHINVNESAVNKILSALGVHGSVTYKLKDGEEIIIDTSKIGIGAV